MAPAGGTERTAVLVRAHRGHRDRRDWLARSINGERAHPLQLPKPSDRALALFVREPFPSVSTGTSLHGGLVSRGGQLEIVSEMDDGGVVFGDGIEDDRLDFAWGMKLNIGISEQRAPAGPGVT